MRLAAVMLAGTVVLGAHTVTADAPTSPPVPAKARRCTFPRRGAWFQLTTCDPHYVLRHSFSMSPGVNPGWVTSCVDRSADATAPGRRYYCRVVFGYEGVNGGNYWIDTRPSRRDNAPQVWGERGSNRSKQGRVITLSNGEMFEGCRKVRPRWSNNYLCDYRTMRPFVLHTTSNGGWAWRYVFHVFWDDWVQHSLNSLSCASGIVGLWYGGRITFPLLWGCRDGPK
jgi:hypothetical protein